jgi:hypothetical protein
VSVRCCVWQVATLVFAPVVAAGDEVACLEAVVGVWTLDVVGVWTPDVVGVWDELDEVELDVEAHPVRNDVVITISPATIGIEFFISPTVHQRWSTNHDDTREARKQGNVAVAGSLRCRCVVIRELPPPGPTPAPTSAVAAGLVRSFAGLTGSPFG